MFKYMMFFGLICCLVPVRLWAEADRPPAPRPDAVWEAAVSFQGDRRAEGYWRDPRQEGQTWVSGHWEGDRYRPGYWKPVRSPGGNSAWAPGHYQGGTWRAGHWRPRRRAGYTWQEAHYTRSGVWHEGQWVPQARAPQGMVWAPGHWRADGNWQDGFWRAEARPGYVWSAGAYGPSGEWVFGQWRRKAGAAPTAAPPAAPAVTPVEANGGGSATPWEDSETSLPRSSTTGMIAPLPWEDGGALPISPRAAATPELK